MARKLTHRLGIDDETGELVQFHEKSPGRGGPGLSYTPRDLNPEPTD